MPILAITNPTYQEPMRVVTAITKGFPALVTTSFAHGYITGMFVRLDIPLDYGMQQANQQASYITVTSDTQFTIDIDTTSYDTFAIPTPWLPLSNGDLVNPQFAQVVPIGEDNAMLSASTFNILKGPIGFFN